MCHLWWLKPWLKPHPIRTGCSLETCSVSGTSSYLVEYVLGQGTFGTVAKCRNIADNKTVAIKMMPNHGSLVERAGAEVNVLFQLLYSDKSNRVQWCQVFTCKQHICLEFEHLDKSLYDFMEERSFQPLLLREIRLIVKQVRFSCGP
ncbi:Homeodomain-interacting protein kinase 1 [Liparis tanakae]|uniref:dual-specificity kinase n=1 Tax=Liparis tanakae TaxID=230148 RepID=A0A4Z2HLY4_9TELE|nr:Homeodomain-interacting protein kinase 1 [Liparis tanakae]